MYRRVSVSGPALEGPRTLLDPGKKNPTFPRVQPWSLWGPKAKGVNMFQSSHDCWLVIMEVYQSIHEIDDHMSEPLSQRKWSPDYIMNSDTRLHGNADIAIYYDLLCWTCRLVSRNDACAHPVWDSCLVDMGSEDRICFRTGKVRDGSPITLCFHPFVFFRSFFLGQLSSIRPFFVMGGPLDGRLEDCIRCSFYEISMCETMVKWN